jgi:tRNA pseudouridine55 synthase
MLGVLLIRKPEGMTSHDVVNVVRKKFNTKRVGHAGTLDPLATGLLVVAVGSATRFLQYLPLEPKEYVADILFGYSTTTYDAEGVPSAPLPVPDPLEHAVREKLPTLTGLIQQLPPMHSAVKVNGQPLYRLARQGQEVEREPRTVHIKEFTPISWGADRLRANIVCSGGTYVRTLAHDLGQLVGCGAHLVGLERSRVGRFTLDMGLELSEVSPEHLIPLKEALPPMPMVTVTEEQAIAIRHGRPLAILFPPERSLVALIDPYGNVFSVARVIGDMLQPECVIPAEVADAVA